MDGKDMSSRLKQQIRIDTPVKADNGRGGRSATWSELATVWAEVIPLRGGEALQQGIERGTQFWRVTIRTRGGVGLEQRLIWNGLTMNIRTVAPNLTRDGLVMTAESGALT